MGEYMITDKTKPHAIFLDIDGTLTAFAKDVATIRDNIIPERNKAAIKKPARWVIKFL